MADEKIHSSEDQSLNEREGVIKFQLEFRPAPALPHSEIVEISLWRDHFKNLGLIGLDPKRYEGLAFGNLSRLLTRRTPHYNSFAVTGTQTGGLSTLGPKHFALVTEYFPAENRMVAQGPIQPSSEAMTHGTLYDLDPSIMWIFHGHSPEIWRNAGELKLPVTDPTAAYGTPEMAREVERLFYSDQLAGRFFVMGGHEDGVMCFGPTAQAVNVRLTEILDQTRS